MLEILLSLLTSGAGGGLLGMLGVFVKSREQRQLKKLDYNYQLASRKLDAEELRLEHQLRLAEHKHQLDRAGLEAERDIELAATELQRASYEADKATYGGGFVDTVRGLMRPVLTSYLTIITTALAVYLTVKLVNINVFTVAELIALYKHIINSVVFLTVTAGVWWFGSRVVNNDN